MLAAWRRASPKLPVPERMAIMLSEAAVSITITSVTDMLSFFIGIFSPFPSVQIFCMYSGKDHVSIYEIIHVYLLPLLLLTANRFAGLAVCFTFVWHLTFFSGCVAISGYREKANRHTITMMKVLPESRARKGMSISKIVCYLYEAQNNCMFCCRRKIIAVPNVLQWRHRPSRPW